MGTKSSSQPESQTAVDRKKFPIRSERDRRDKLYYIVMQVIHLESINGESNLSIARVSYHTGLSMSQFKETVNHLRKLGFIYQHGNNVCITEKGIEFVKEYSAIHGKLKEISLK